ncbi:MAG: thiamine phosphate synthase [Alteromonadaceae bacterium]|nr:thiamine phosphate synthase [Alteromonadaceae bacterium]
MKKTLWTIAGSDSGGGAGIQADIKTMASFGLQGSTVITVLTAQNSAQVLAINPVSIKLLNSQLSALEQDKLPQVIKIGLLANIEQVEFIVKKITHYKNTWSKAPLIVYDPVAVASTGDSLVEEDTLAIIKEKLLPLIDVLTPNTAETQRITGVYLISSQAVIDAANAFKKLGVKAVVIKGGHWDVIDGYCIDFATEFTVNHSSEQYYWLASKNIATMHTHGTGCSFASVIAACLTLDYPFKDAFILAKAYINQGLKVAKQIAYGEGSVAHLGFPENLNDFPEIVEPHSPLAQALALDYNGEKQRHAELVSISGFPQCKQPLGLYAVVDSLNWLELCLEQGIKTVQLRIKNKDTPQLSDNIVQAVKLAEKHKAQLFINDHWQLAIEHGAYGVHLGQEDLVNADLAAIKTAGLRLGISTHGFYEMLQAHYYQPSYMAFGAVYPTPTKDMRGQIQGLGKLKHFVPLMKQYSCVAIGGINLERVDEVLKTGIKNIAVVSAITKADDAKQAIKQLLGKIK